MREPIQEPAMTLSEIDTLGNQLLQEHEDKSGLEPGWKFGFDLAPARGGVFRHTEKQDVPPSKLDNYFHPKFEGKTHYHFLRHFLSVIQDSLTRISENPRL